MAKQLNAVKGKSINYGRRTFVIRILNKWNTLPFMLTKPGVLLQGEAGNLRGAVKLDAHTRLENTAFAKRCLPWAFRGKCRELAMCACLCVYV